MVQPKEQAQAAAPEPAREETAQGKKPSGSQGAYVIQIQSAPTVEEANRIVSVLKARGEDAYTARTTVKGGGTWYRVYIGRFASNNEAMYHYKEREFDKRYPGSIVQYVPRHGEAS
jgi:cell division septation protein DedD